MDLTQETQELNVGGQELAGQPSTQNVPTGTTVPAPTPASVLLPTVATLVGPGNSRRRIMGYDPYRDQHKEGLDKCNDELEGIAYQNANDWPLLIKEKAFSERTKHNPLSWQSICGEAAPNLRLIAMDILGLTTVASVCERGWSLYGFVHSKLRNRLAVDRQHKLVYVHHNARINGIDHKCHRKSARLLNTFYTS
ncbi:hypothetical protein R1flu_014998 [Riccia fluitans]|uniref:HAT C-terminal dimerisation domain-containing protein n=1 Tax=Riccia fluitans TaxID=41844 RepID=A0ABD1YKU4_9MARC